MKKTFFYYLFFVLALATVVTACSEDEDMKADDFKAAVFESGKGLTLNYSGQPMLGKRVTFTPVDGAKATLELSGADIKIGTRATEQAPVSAGVIPGEPITRLNIELRSKGDKAAFEGIDEKDGRVIEYSGEMTSESLLLNLNVKMPQSPLSGKTFKLLPMPQGENAPEETSPLMIKWTADKFTSGISLEDLIKKVLVGLPVFDGHTGLEMLCGSLNEIRFLEDGNIQASYRGEKTNGQWVDSPLNLATYVVRGDKVCVFLNIAQIAFLQTRAEDNAIANLLAIVSKVMVEGIPVTYALDGNGGAAFYLDERTILPILQLMKPLFESKEIKDIILNLINEKAGDLAPMIAKVVGPMLEEFPHIIDTTTEIRLGIRTTEVVK